jgi:polar amino acid transport system substrate-binding protein
VAAACGIPRDPEGTLERVSDGTIRVGVTAAKPWTVLEGDEPMGGVEVRLVKDFAASIDAEIEWVEGSEEEIFGAIELRELDLAIGGFSSVSPWSSKVTFTHPYLTTFATVGVPDAAETTDDIAGMKVAVETGTELAGLLEKTDAVPILVTDIAQAEGAAAVEDWLLDDLGLHPTDVRLKETDHVMAVPHGENAWLTTLERFLLDSPDEIGALLESEGRP